MAQKGKVRESIIDLPEAERPRWVERRRGLDARGAGRERLVGVGEEQVRNWLREARLAAGVPDRIWPHLLRHSFATEVARATDPETWRVAMNHADLSQYARYVHTDSERTRAAFGSIRL